jgi:hypothetical protein
MVVAAAAAVENADFSISLNAAKTMSLYPPMASGFSIAGSRGDPVGHTKLAETFYVVVHIFRYTCHHDPSGIKES